jgi:hypothetical protein
MTIHSTTLHKEASLHTHKFHFLFAAVAKRFAGVRASALSVLILVLVSMPALGQISQQDVNFIIGNAAESTGNSNLIANGYNIPMVASATDNGDWSWNVQINHIVNNYSSLTATPYTAKVTGMLNKLDFVFLGIGIRPQVEDLIFDHEDLQKNVLKWRNKYPDVDMTFGTHEGHIYMTAAYNYAGVSKSTLFNRIKHMCSTAYGIMLKGVKADKEMGKRRREELEETKITSITNNDLVLVLDHDILEYQEKSDYAKVGYFNWTREEKRNLEVINNGDELIFAQWFDVGDDQGLMSEVINEANAYLEEKKVKHAASTVAGVDQEISTVLSVKAVFPLAPGSYTGKQLREGYEDYRDDFGKDIRKRLSKLIDKTAESRWDRIKEDKPTYLAKADIEYVLDDNFEGVEGEAEDAKEGFFEFTLDEKLNVEVTNSGDRLLLGLYWEMSEDVSEEQISGVVERVNAYLAKKNVKHFPATASIYPDYANLVLVSTQIPVDGTSSHLRIREAYQHMMYDFGKNLDKEVRKAIAR